MSFVSMKMMKTLNELIVFLSTQMLAQHKDKLKLKLHTLSERRSSFMEVVIVIIQAEVTQRLD